MSLYSASPDLSHIEMHEVRTHRDGPLVQLRFDLPAFPDQPPARWPDEAFVAQVVVDLWDIMLQLEEDMMTEAEKELKAAEKALKDALEKGASEEEL
mgnify:CR=1 FL=1